MIERNYIHAVVGFLQKGKEPFLRLTKELCKEDDLYHSDPVSYIN
ncbi:MAG: hypothetical protein NZM26_03725 [Patescibacteria group bacterium]|nr:hypothetical protein [Patescibacteria group bacterium]